MRCAYCCSCKGWRIYLNYFDLIKLKDYNYAIERCEGFFNYRLKVNEKGCILLKDNLCRVHIEKGLEYKPLMCLIFPFSCMVKWDGTPLLIIKHYCNGIKKGKIDKKIVKKAIEYIKELYFDKFDNFLKENMEYSSKTYFDEKNRITWEYREELGRYLFNSKNFDELGEKIKEIFNIDINLKRHHDEEEIIRYLLELNRREHFRKLTFKDEVNILLKIANYLTKFKNVLEGEKEIDKMLFIYQKLYL
ncbi:hypothetical protein J422_03928 [Methanocaldococcus villosus KIN24-T80]|uniref:YkgJ family cysteine cluster protein n=1 Tax=Methanocaldococcus villosus KIN24-T80 TaxID=1069083 RepID=N6VYH4_9EURY|nr:YkgJ family cysteine cluster protein [Methanocaldococcus villosus]ENN96172.1 hypothetical protein J422_03928 [Methanocaldococcus villosus KIN24-T80]